jgi:DNA recombination protein RmuC
MELTSILLVVIAILIIANILIVIFGNKKKTGQDDHIGFKLLLEQMNTLSKVVDEKMRDTSSMMQDSMKTQFSESQKMIKDVTVGLTKLDETNRQVVSFADQLQSLQDILKNPKQRGVLGEYYLETLLKNVLAPGSYQMQYGFNDGSIVDAVVFVKEKVIPIDSKFSLENYNRIVEEKNEVEKAKLEKIFENDLKNRIVETSKYIKPSENTMDFAFMFIPHEAIYYDLITGKVGGSQEENLIQRAAGKYKVIIVSPTSFLAYLQTVLQGLKAMQIEDQAKDIIKRVGELVLHLKKYSEIHNKLGTSLGTVVNHFTASSNEFKKIDKDIIRLTSKEESIGFEAISIEKPEVEE